MGPSCSAMWQRGRPNRNTRLIASTLVALLGRKEQEGIAEYLTRANGRLHGLEQSFAEQISRLRVYRTAMISAAIAGKIDVQRMV